MSDIASTTMRESLIELYRELDDALTHSSGRCEQSGRCCRFTEFEHTLFLSASEAEFLFERGLPPGTNVSEHFCPYQVHNLCTARERRPIGCRIFFCNKEFRDEMPQIAELWTTRLKRLHDSLGIPWDYRPLHRFLTPSNGEMEPKPESVRLPILDSSRCSK